MTVKEFCKRYKVSCQAVYQKIKRNRELLDGHIIKDGSLAFDEFAEELLRPKIADNKIFSENEKLLSEISDKNIELDFLRDELPRKVSENEKLQKLVTEYTEKISNLERRLEDECSKNTELEKSICKLSDEILEKRKEIESLRREINELTEQLNAKSKSWFKK